MRRTPLLICVLAVLVVAPARTTRAQDSAALINQQLDTLIKVDLKSTLPEAMKTIAAETGVRLDATPAVWELLPYGRQTPLTAKLENVTLREGLVELTRALGLMIELKAESVEIQPMPALIRLGRRATVNELKTLLALSREPLGAAIDAKGINTANLLAAVDEKLAKMSPRIDFENRAGDLAATQTIGVAKGVTVLDALEALATQSNATWYPWGSGVVVLKKQELVAAQLSKPISLRYTGEDITQVLQDLSVQSGVAFTFRPGSIQLIPAEFRRIRLVIDNATFKQALESISAFTGLGYSYDDNGVYIWNQTYGIDAGQRDPVVVLLDLGDGVQVPLPRSQLPSDVQQYIDAKRTEQAVRIIREKMKKDGFVPTTQPAGPDL
ncbi:MAG TPA: hypothetical protein PLD59_15820 [Tepidisphaeraceae bacterium]|nr:hypothetical protein [Tepidisphaeraceae bacterium]